MTDIKQLANNFEELRRNFEKVDKKTRQALRIHKEICERKIKLLKTIPKNESQARQYVDTNEDFFKSFKNLHDKELRLMQAVVRGLDTGGQVVQELIRELSQLPKTEKITEKLNAVRLVFEITRNHRGHLNMRLAHEENYINSRNYQHFVQAYNMFKVEKDLNRRLHDELSGFRVRNAIKFFQDLRNDINEKSKKLEMATRIKKGKTFGTITGIAGLAGGVAVPIYHLAYSAHTLEELLNIIAMSTALMGLSGLILGFLGGILESVDETDKLFF